MIPATYLPRPYQAEGEARILTTDCLGLFIEPGGGKTITALTAADRLMHEGFEVRRTLVVAPKLVAREVWAREAAKWAHLAHLKIRHITAEDMGYKRVSQERTRKGQAFIETTVKPADRKAVRKMLLESPETIHVVSRDHLYWLVELMGKWWPYELVLGDESSSYKDHMSQRSRALRFLMRKGLVNRVVLMSGTPSPKGLEQLWAQVLILDNGQRLGSSLTQFRERFMTPDKRNRDKIFSWKPRPGAVDDVMSKIGDICLSVRADVWRQNEPPRTVQRVVRLDASAREQYETLRDELVLQVEQGLVTAVNAGVLHGKLCQLASGVVFDREQVAHVIHDEKLDALEALVEELDGQPLLVLYWFKPNLVRLKERFPQVATTDTPGFIDKFGRGELPILLLQPASAGHGLDGLQHGGHHVAVFDIPADWELYKQAIDRIDRSGQKHQVTVTQIIAEDTLDERVAGVLAQRGAAQGDVLDAIRYEVQGRG